MVTDPESRREQAIAALVPLFFVSGATSLVYQTLWARELQLIVGTSQFAIATVLSAFMGGLAVGGLVMSRFADRIKRPLLTYGLLEIGIGLYALLFPWMLDAVEPVYLGFYRAFSPGPLAYGLFQFVLLGALLLLPTSFMGATLPLLARFTTTRLGAAGDRVGLLYGVNTFGAVLGIAVAGFWVLPELGVRLTTLGAAAANGLLGLGALVLSRSSEEATLSLEPDHDIEVELRPNLTPVLLGAALTGFASLVYEVAWFRLVGLMLGGSTYAFSTMLLAFLTGIALGGWAGGPYADASLRDRGPGGPLRGFMALQVGVALLTWLMMYLYQELPFLFVMLFDLAGGAEGLLWPMKVLLAALVMTPPALLMGASFPFLVRAAVGSNEGALGQPVGQVYGANTLGSIFGSFAAGFVLLPLLRVTGAVSVANAANVLAAFIALVGALHIERSLRPKAVLIPALLGLGFIGLGVRFPPPWEPLLMTAGLYKYVSEFSDHSREGVLNFAVREYDLLFYEEGLSSVVTVAQSKGSGNIWLANNGKVDASTTVDMPTQVMVAHLPFLFVEAPEDVLVIGLASGITLGAATLHQEPKSIEVVELEPSILKASHYFDDYNHDPLSDPRVKLIANDGRNHLLLAQEGAYDLIISEPSNPWLTGVSNLFTLEFFEMGKTRLKPGGVWSQWVQLYGMGQDDLRSLLRTFATVYPYVVLFATIEDADLVLVGSDRPLPLSVGAAERLLSANPAVAEELRQISILDPFGVLTLYQLDRDGLLELAGDAPFNTDDNLLVEFSAPRYLHRDTSTENMQLILPKAQPPPLVGQEHNVALAQAYALREEWLRALLTLRRVEGAGPEVEVLRGYYEQMLREQLGLTPSEDGGEDGD